MYSQVNYVHGDLSRYNILWWNNKPWIIDMPQAYLVGPWADMKNAEMLLRRDIVNVLSYLRSKSSQLPIRFYKGGFHSL